MNPNLFESHGNKILLSIQPHLPVYLVQTRKDERSLLLARN